MLSSLLPYRGRRITSRGQKDLDQIAGQVCVCVCVHTRAFWTSDVTDHANSELLLTECSLLCVVLC